MKVRGRSETPGYDLRVDWWVLVEVGHRAMGESGRTGPSRRSSPGRAIAHGSTGGPNRLLRALKEIPDSPGASDPRFHFCSRDIGIESRPGVEQGCHSRVRAITW